VIVRPAKLVRGRLSLPGDKSISHRAAMIAALADGTSRITNFSNSADCTATLSCLTKLGVSIERRGNELLVHGVGPNGLRAPAEPLDCANSGTTMRLLAGVLAGQNFESTLTGDESLRSRPMARIIEPLRMMGASISSTDGRAPLVIEGHEPLKSIKHELPVASAQVKSCILLAGLSAAGQTEVTEPLTVAGGSRGVTRDHTERMLRWFGVPLEVRDVEGLRAVTVDGPARFNARDVSIPGDISSAAYFIAAAALLPGSALEITGVGVNPTRATFLEQLRSLGFDVAVSNVREECNEAVGTICISGSKSSSESASPESASPLRGPVIPQLIDELPLLAVVGSQIEGGIEIRDAAELRAKESDRIAATVRNLRAMGAEVEEFNDGLRVAGPAPLRGAEIDPGGDHRIAMAFSVAGLIAQGETEIKDAECVAVSFPEFFELLESVVER
jgi:3-phosphoshikimate 1-carboxyvinyltransferase